ncbi:MAG TPA: glycyl-radical enzyme activating protein [Bacillota bacterium]
MAGARVFNVQRFSLQDGPGIRTTVFFKGCPLDCRWCHNPEGRSDRPDLLFHQSLCRACFTCRLNCPEEAILDSPDIRVNRSACSLCLRCASACPYGALTVAGTDAAPLPSLFKQVVRDTSFYRNSGGGVTASGGEPLVQAQAVRELFVFCRGRAIDTALDTSGHAPWEHLQEVEPFTDLFLYDLKSLDPAAHEEWTGVGNDLILANLTRLCETRARDVRIRIPLIAGFNDEAGQLREMARFVSALAVQGIDLLPYHSFAQAKYRALNIGYALDGRPDYDLAEAQKKASIMAELVESVTVGG